MKKTDSVAGPKPVSRMIEASSGREKHHAACRSEPADPNNASVDWSFRPHDSALFSCFAFPV